MVDTLAYNLNLSSPAFSARFAAFAALFSFRFFTAGFLLLFLPSLSFDILSVFKFFDLDLWNIRSYNDPFVSAFNHGDDHF